MDRPTEFPELEDRILPWSQVKVISGLSRTTVWRLQKSGDFPASVQVSPNRVGWWQSEILDWRRSRLPRRLPEPRHAPLAPPTPTPMPKPKLWSRRVDVEAVRPVAPTPRKRRRPTHSPNQGAFDF